MSASDSRNERCANLITSGADDDVVVLAGFLNPVLVAGVDELLGTHLQSILLLVIGMGEDCNVALEVCSYKVKNQ